MDKNYFYALMEAKGTSDYEVYLKTNELLSCQKKFQELCNQDELQFQIVHQIEEMLLKLISYTLLSIIDYMAEHKTFRVLTNFHRIHIIQKNIINMIDLLETMSPSDYQSIRLHLGAGSGVTSPGFKTLNTLFPEVWNSFKAHYLDYHQTSIEKIYSSAYEHEECYAIAEAMADMDELYHRFFKRHIELIGRTIGENSKSLRGRPVETLKAHSEQHLFPEIWDIRNQMTDLWGQEYGVVRPSLSQ
jgi:tryptophan 2,3-dioxygenase